MTTSARMVPIAPMPGIRAITLDLDDTLWPVAPVIERAERVVHAWLLRRAPATAAAYDVGGLRLLRDAVARERPDSAHDFSALRHEALRRALTSSGEDPALSDEAFDVFFAARQRVTLFEDVLPALELLAAHGPVVAVSNGNADLGRIGIDRFFVGAVSARGFGVGKPDPRIFHAACEMAGAEPAEVLHVGDDWQLDVQGALRAGLQAAWMTRPGLVLDPGHAGAHSFGIRGCSVDDDRRGAPADGDSGSGAPSNSHRGVGSHRGIRGHTATGSRVARINDLAQLASMITDAP